MDAFIENTVPNLEDNIERFYRDIDMLKWELEILHNSLIDYINKKSGTSLSQYDRQVEMNRIRERIGDVYKSINFYKECINTEYKEIRRLYETYIHPIDTTNDTLEDIKDYVYNSATGIFE